jgi:hypothetical protein
VRATCVRERAWADVVLAANFSIGEMRTRADLLRYLASARERLRPDGIFACDTYGGESAYRIGALERRHRAPDGAIVRHVWEQRASDPTTGEVVNALHFRVEREGEIVHAVRDAFVYRWRLWSIPELRDALAECGFASTEVHVRLAPADGSARIEPVQSPSDLDASFVACIVARMRA